HESAHGLVIGRFEQRHYVVRAQRPEFLNDLHAHFFGLGDGGFASLDGILDVTDALIGKPNKTDIRGHSACSFREVFLKDYCRFASAQKIRMKNRIASKHLTFELARISDSKSCEGQSQVSFLRSANMK